METTNISASPFPRRSKKPYAIVIGLDVMNGIQTARILARRGVPIIGIVEDLKHYCCLTNVCKRILLGGSENGQNGQMISVLDDLGQKLDRKAVLFPCTDRHVLFVSRYRDKLKRCYHVILPPPHVVEMMMNKVSFYAYAQEKGFPIPRTCFLHISLRLKTANECYSGLGEKQQAKSV